MTPFASETSEPYEYDSDDVSRESECFKGLDEKEKVMLGNSNVKSTWRSS